MADEPQNLTLQLLCRIDQRVQGLEVKIDRLTDDVNNLKVCTSGVEEGLAGVNRRLDRLDMRVDRIERRLELPTPRIRNDECP
jgi:archaellum component FlaC